MIQCVLITVCIVIVTLEFATSIPVLHLSSYPFAIQYISCINKDIGKSALKCQFFCDWRVFKCFCLYLAVSFTDSIYANIKFCSSMWILVAWCNCALFIASFNDESSYHKKLPLNIRYFISNIIEEKKQQLTTMHVI